MKDHLDQLMQDAGFDALLVYGPSEGNTALRYLSSGAKLTHGIAIKKHGEEPVLIVGGMERDEAAKSGLPVVVSSTFNYIEHYKETEDAFEARVLMYRDMLAHFEVTGTVAVYGVSDPGSAYLFLKALNERLEGITITGETGNTVLDKAMITKGADELAALHDVAERTNAVFAQTIAFIKGHRSDGEKLVSAEGLPLTVGDVKRHVRGLLLTYGLEEAHDMIFAIGRDAGVPHSRGEEDDLLALGKTIVFDLFPRDPNTGYFHDMTRTFSIGYATEEVQQAYDQVMQAFNTVMEQLKVGERTAYYQELTCEIFGEYGHPTPISDPSTQEGYVHSLGHGVGLQLHEFPRLSDRASDVLAEGQVFSVEPGLYYPEKGWGIRVEDLIFVDADGNFHSMTPTPKDLVIEVEEA
jgi:Xaa-Pro aminopeptidase